MKLDTLGRLSVLTDVTFLQRKLHYIIKFLKVGLVFAQSR